MEEATPAKTACPILIDRVDTLVQFSDTAIQHTTEAVAQNPAPGLVLSEVVDELTVFTDTTRCKTAANGVAGPESVKRPEIKGPSSV